MIMGGIIRSKVKYNIKNVHYALKTDSGYETPVGMPGAVSLSLEQQGDVNQFYADGLVYYQAAANNGYEGDLELALIPESFRTAVLNEEKDSVGVLFENANSTGNEFALGFQIDTDTNPILFWFFSCTATRPSVEANTKEDTIEPETDTLTISCAPDDDGYVRAKTTGDSYDTVKDTWFTQVYTKSGE